MSSLLKSLFSVQRTPAVTKGHFIFRKTVARTCLTASFKSCSHPSVVQKNGNGGENWRGMMRNDSTSWTAYIYVQHRPSGPVFDHVAS